MLNKSAILRALAVALSFGSPSRYAGRSGHGSGKLLKQSSRRAYSVNKWPRNRKTTTAARQKRAALKRANQRKHPKG